MENLFINLDNSSLLQHYQKGMLKLLPVPVNYGTDSSSLNKEFFAYISTLGGGLVSGDSYSQKFIIKNSTKATISSQSSQKIYKGNSNIDTRIEIDNSSVFVFHNDANIFYPNSNFNSKTQIFAKKSSKLFLVDGGFTGYAKNNFKANLNLRLYIDSKLSLNDNFNYESIDNLQAFYKHEYFYTLLIIGAPDFITVHNEDIKVHASTINNVTMVRIMADNNGKAIEYINKIKGDFLQESGMSSLSIR